jgi:hypothetical protein
MFQSIQRRYPALDNVEQEVVAAVLQNLGPSRGTTKKFWLNPRNE